jgi:hypothetical protein
MTIFVFVFLSSQVTFANSHIVSKIGTEIRGLKTPNSLGILYGWHYMHHRSDTFSVGGAAYTGQISEGRSGSFSYGGLAAAYNGQLSQNLGAEIGILAGGGGGFNSLGEIAGGIIIEPNAALSFVFGKYVRVALTAGYMYMPNYTSFSGISGGLRFDFLSILESDPKSPETKNND